MNRIQDCVSLNACASNLFLISLQNGEQLLIIPQSPTEWLAIEDCLWELDVREAKSPGKPILQANSISSDADDLLSRLLQKVCLVQLWYMMWNSKCINSALVALQNDTLCFECLSYLRVEDLARLSKVGTYRTVVYECFLL